MAKVQHGIETLRKNMNQLSRVQERYRQTTHRRRTSLRQHIPERHSHGLGKNDQQQPM